MSALAMPTYDQLMQPTIDALRRLQSRGTGRQIYAEVIDALNLPLEIAPCQPL